MKTLNQYILENTTNFRCWITMPFQKIENSFADVDWIYNYSVPENTTAYWSSASGCANYDENLAILWAIWESLERYSAFVYDFEIKKIDEVKDQKYLTYDDFSLFSDEQYNNKNFPFKKIEIKDIYFWKMYNIYTNEEIYIPQEMIWLWSKYWKVNIPTTSTWLATHFDKYRALLLSLQESLERDALTVYWQNSLPWRDISDSNFAKNYKKEIENKWWRVYFFDITQDWNPHPVILTCWYLIHRNKKRISMWVACKENYEKAIKKSFTEWAQWTIFANYYSTFHPWLEFKKFDELRDFDHHAVYYTLYPQIWDKVPIINKSKKYSIDLKKNNKWDSKELLKDLLNTLKKEKIQFYYKDITSIDLNSIWLYVYKSISPDLSLIHWDEQTPFLWWKINDVKWRYWNFFDNKEIIFPNKYPHPLW